MDLISAIKSAIDGRALLILGAGFSRNAYNLRHCSMPSADGLRKLFILKYVMKTWILFPKRTGKT